ncbi:hypothetical protein HPP_5120 [Hydrangea phyllody phytoplasma]|uniref:Uncharacterized protein n=2 Tax=16SrI (Aster yellows group) TaxID=3042590 RepID=A0ABQ5PS97_9MOLU|nr:hypothetical protein [Hydrangea phyllody phytoplasma]GFZ75554.1 hypothetical protein HPP_5120 [Hydrangea phyllody phytoplasma]GLH61342.1 hypothetical protein RHYP_2880 [Rhus yellows phytoplasma]GLH62110.1 hypothetical protein HP2P_5170 [Hydrangea phyllody phytoplasma]
MDKKQKIKKEFHEHCQCCGSYLGININDVYLNLFGFIMFSIIFFSCGILLLYSSLIVLLGYFFNVIIFNEEFFLILGFISVISLLLFFLIAKFMPKLLFEKIDYEKVEKE